MFQTQVNIPLSKFSVNYESALITLGSCFAENMGKKMSAVWFDVCVNPFGVLYNPSSIAESLRRLMQKKWFEERELFQSRGLWNSFAHSTLFSCVTQAQTLEKMNRAFMHGVRQMEKPCVLLITFGTAWVYEECENGKVVANCHKLPSAAFKRRKLTVDEIVNEYRLLLADLHSLYPDLKIVFSVSPVRHWKDGAHENNLSKSTLLLAIDTLTGCFDFVDYFPAYEIQMDELRDYRFYAADMLHPSETAIDYIWQKFSETYFSQATRSAMHELEKLAADLKHEALFPESEEFRKFESALQKKINRLQSLYPFLQGRMQVGE